MNDIIKNERQPQTEQIPLNRDFFLFCILKREGETSCWELPQQSFDGLNSQHK